jgi:hypothetical protein
MLVQGTSEREWNRVLLYLHCDRAFGTLPTLLGNCRESRILHGRIGLCCISEAKVHIVSHRFIGSREKGLTQLFQHQNCPCCRMFRRQIGWIHHVW